MPSPASNTPSVLLDFEPLTVYWEDSPDRRRVVRRGCKICKGDISDPAIVSPSGVAHESEGYGITICGKDATRFDWWWRL